MLDWAHLLGSIMDYKVIEYKVSDAREYYSLTDKLYLLPLSPAKFLSVKEPSSYIYHIKFREVESIDTSRLRIPITDVLLLYNGTNSVYYCIDKIRFRDHIEYTIQRIGVLLLQAIYRMIKMEN